MRNYYSKKPNYNKINNLLNYIRWFNIIMLPKFKKRGEDSMSSEFIVGLLEIILINIILSGDNAVVIALACRNLDAKYQKKAVVLGSVGAIGLRVGLTFVAVYLLQIPYLNFIGGILLLWIAIKLLKGEEEEDIKGSSNLMGGYQDNYYC